MSKNDEGYADTDRQTLWGKKIIKTSAVSTTD